MTDMFCDSLFNGDISKWNINIKMFMETPQYFKVNGLDEDIFFTKLSCSYKPKNQTEINISPKNIYINHIRKRLKI